MEAFDYYLPKEFIAQRPVEPPHAAKMLVVDRSNKLLHDRIFMDLPRVLPPGAILLINDSRVLPARLQGYVESKSGVVGPGPRREEAELLILEPVAPSAWLCIGRPLRRLRRGDEFSCQGRLCAVVVETPNSQSTISPGEREVIMEFRSPDGLTFSKSALDQLVSEIGVMPIPPYIRDGNADARDAVEYQTPFGVAAGSIAAPTASLHFSPKLIDELKHQNFIFANLTLHIGASSIFALGTKGGELERPGEERFVVTEELLDRIHIWRQEGRKVYAVGTSVARAIESAVLFGVESGRTDLFITPGFDFKVIDGLITNFHHPRTTHLLLVEALLGRELLNGVYNHALVSKYRFLSYGDGMLIL